ncbi:hypothetical protein AB6A40_000339 [Gnathostoma spinigerum]|uniref:Uncharacterized protein n=1 Tax=Gnathostoma spinigerum TaxID=75299 RepID=A0ABD6E2V2_9BILA
MLSIFEAIELSNKGVIFSYVMSYGIFDELVITVFTIKNRARLELSLRLAVANHCRDRNKRGYFYRYSNTVGTGPYYHIRQNYGGGYGGVAPLYGYPAFAGCGLGNCGAFPGYAGWPSTLAAAPGLMAPGAVGAAPFAPAPISPAAFGPASIAAAPIAAAPLAPSPVGVIGGPGPFVW